MGRYQLELEQIRKECRDRFEGISSGACSTCEKFIQINLGRHVAQSADARFGRERLRTV